MEGKGFAEKELDIDCGCNKGFGKHHDEGVYDPCPFSHCGGSEYGAGEDGKSDGGLSSCQRVQKGFRRGERR